MTPAEQEDREVWFRFFIEITPDATVVVDENGTIRMVNSLALELFGYSREEMMDQAVEMLVPEEVRAKHPELRENFVAVASVRQMQSSIDLMAQTKSGKLLPVSIGLSPMETSKDGHFVMASVRDNSVLHSAHAAVEARSVEIRNISDTASDAIITMNEASEILSWNPASIGIFGYSVEEAIGQKIEMIVPERFRQQHLDGVARIKAGVQGNLLGTSIEVEGLRKNGEIFPIEMSLATWIGEGGRVFCGILRDISERKIIDEKLRKSEKYIKALIDQLPAAIAIKNTGGQYTLANQTFHEWYADKNQTVIGLTSHDIYPKDGADELTQIDRRVRETGVAETQEILEPFADGSKHNLLMSKFSIEDVDGNIAVGSVETDITDRKAAEEKLKQSGERLDLALKGGDMGFWDVDLETHQTIVNERYVDMLGYTLSEIDDVYELWKKSIYQEDRDRVYLAGQEYRAGKLEVYEIEYRATTKLGEIRWLVTKGAAVQFDASGVPVRMVGTVRDVTERKEAQEELRISRDAAEEAAKAKATFLATMSHEIRTPMGGVIGMVDILKQTSLSDDQRQMVDTVHDSAHSLLTIINDILDFSKIEAGKLDLEEIPISMRDVVEGAGEALAVNARNKNIGLSVFVDPDIPDALLGDQVRLRQIIFNFGSNAIKFTETGKVLIRADLLPSETKDNATVQIQVIDDGIGIPKDAQKTLFQAFSQVDASTTRRFGGTGLGLSICQRLIKMMDGEIGVESESGEGSTFTATISLPVAPEHEIESDGNDLSGIIVLAAVGDEDMRRLLPRYLNRWDATVTTVGEIEEVKPLVLKAADTKKPFDVVYLNSAWPLTERINLVETLASEKALSTVQYVLACQGRTRAERKKIGKTIYVDSDPLRRGALIKSIAVAAGRANPDIGYDEKKSTRGSGKLPTVDEAEAMGQLILLAEDNITNQDVIRRQLNILGFALEIANDGKEALEMLKARSFAILLTDCHMPNMDGFELAQSIRETEEGTDSRFPIIAVTASVMKDEVDQCIEAGMDDCLAKPLEMQKLEDMLRKWIPESAPLTLVDEIETAPVEISERPSRDFEDGNSAIDPSALKNVFGDDEETFKEILTEFIDPATDNIQDLMTAFAGRSAGDVGMAAHKLKSSARSVGANDLADLCQTLEAASKAENWAIIDGAAPQLSGTFQSVVDYIKNL